MKTKWTLAMILLFSVAESFADTLTLSCPDISSLRKTNDQWTALIPATNTTEKKPIPATLLTSPAGVAGYDIKIQTSAAIDNVKKTITCTYNTATEPQNGKYIDLVGTNPAVFTLFAECNITGGTVADPIYKINCTK